MIIKYLSELYFSVSVAVSIRIVLKRCLKIIDIYIGLLYPVTYNKLSSSLTVADDVIGLSGNFPISIASVYLYASD